MKAVLGIDTSCYTTSAAIVSLEKEILVSARRLLTVQMGGRGLQQSAGLFQHIQNLPQMIDQAVHQAGDIQIEAVSASTKPRPAEDSYMPVFRAGESQARAAASLLNVPFYAFSHQEGHVRAALVGTEIDEKQQYIVFHLSGGTTEMLACNPQLQLIGKSLDLHAGQFIDRIGVKMGLPFPAGPYLEKLAEQAKPSGVLGVSIRDCDCSISGAESKASRLIDSRAYSNEQIAAECFDFIARTVFRMMENGLKATGAKQALLAGGVASSDLFRKMLYARARKAGLQCRICFARPELSGDNAVGIALLGVDHYSKLNH